MKNFLNRYTKANSDNPLWLIVLSDIMTNLMLFFLIMYVFTLQGKDMKKAFADGFDKKKSEMRMKEKKGEDLIKKIKEKDAVRTISKELEEAGLKDVSEVEMTEKYIRINLSAPILFYSGSADLNLEAKNILTAMGNLLRNLKQNDITIEGHTDSVPIKSGKWETNWQLSAARADAVVEFLHDNSGIPNEKLISAAFGEYRPIASNATREGRAKNRRIEIMVMRNND